VRLIFIFDAFGTGTPTFGMFGHRNASGRDYLGNFLAESSRTSGPPQSSSAFSKMVDELWVNTKFHLPPASEEHPDEFLHEAKRLGMIGITFGKTAPLLTQHA